MITIVIAHSMCSIEAEDKVVELKDSKVADKSLLKKLYENESNILRRMADLQSANAAWSV